VQLTSEPNYFDNTKRSIDYNAFLKQQDEYSLAIDAIDKENHQLENIYETILRDISNINSV
jgi:hypothetical protein